MRATILKSLLRKQLTLYLGKIVSEEGMIPLIGEK